MSCQPACTASVLLALWSSGALSACAVDRRPEPQQGQRDPSRQARATATLSAPGASSSSLVASATLVATSESVDLLVRLQGCTAVDGYSVRILEAESCAGVDANSASFRDDSSDAIPRLLCGTAGASSDEGRLRYARPASAAGRWSVGDGSDADVVGHAVAIFSSSAIEPIACGVLEPAEDRVLVAQPPLDEPPSAEARAVVAGMCAFDVDSPGSCLDPVGLAACATEHCELGACLEQCREYATCTDAAADACLAPSVCAQREACAECQLELTSCTQALCEAHIACPGVSPKGP